MLSNVRYPLALKHAVIAFAAVIASWYGMQLLHEVGHILAASLSGGRVKALHMPLFGFSRTDVHPNPHPTRVVWAGPIFGALAPLSLLPIVIKAVHPRKHHPIRRLYTFFCGFCLIANGGYLFGGAIMPVGDVSDMLRLGINRYAIAAVGLPFIIAGLALWDLVRLPSHAPAASDP